MREGLAIVVSPSAGTYYGVSRVGWLHRIEGDEWEICSCRILQTTGEYVAFAKMADVGPDDNTKLGVISKFPEPIHRSDFVRTVYCTVENWLRHCPKPDGMAEKPR